LLLDNGKIKGVQNTSNETSQYNEIGDAINEENNNVINGFYFKI
jgi:hypothetical protein